MGVGVSWGVDPWWGGGRVICHGGWSNVGLVCSGGLSVGWSVGWVALLWGTNDSRHSACRERSEVTCSE